VISSEQEAKSFQNLIFNAIIFNKTVKTDNIYAEVVTFVAGSLEAGGLPGSLEIPEVLK
jgi:hypothetical protein